MIVFLISLRSEASSSNWKLDEKLFNDTLRSIFNQTCDDFLVYVGCNKIPHLYDRKGNAVEYDNRLRFVVKDLPVPTTHTEKCRDRSWKLLYCAEELRKDFDKYAQNGKLYIMPVDADDYINRNIAQYCKYHPNEFGFKSRLGYRYSYGKRFFVKTPYFGGSMNIMSLSKYELPETMPKETEFYNTDTAGYLRGTFPIIWDDNKVEGKFREMGRPFKRLPFKSTVYVVDTGSNISQQNKKAKDTDRKRIHLGVMLRKINIFRYKFIGRKVRKEFGMI